MIKKVELIVEKNSIDLFGDESFPLSFSIDEINDIGKKAASYSKEINIPATQLNNQIFTSLFDVTVDGGFNPISRKYAVLLVDGVPVMRGYFKLLGVNIKDNEYVTYRGLLYEEQINFIQALDQYELINLNIPATGTTTNMVGPYTYLSEFQIISPNITTGNVGVTNTGAFWTQAVDYNTLQWTGLSYGALSSQNRLVGNSSANGINITMPTGYYWNPASMNAYEASSAQYVEFSANIAIRVIRQASTPHQPKISWRVIKSDYVNPLSGAFTDIVIANGEVTGPSVGAPIVPISQATFTVNINTIGIQLGTGDKIRLEMWYNNPATNTSISISPTTSSIIRGKVYTGPTQTVTGQTFNLNSVLQNINNVTTSDDAKVTFPLIDYSNLYSFKKTSVSILTNTTLEFNNLNINVEDLRPTVFVKHVWDAIFKQAGFKYKSEFLNSPTFKKMIIAGGIEETEISSTMLSTIVNPHRTSYELSLHTNADVQTPASATGASVTGYRYEEFHMGNADLSAATGSTMWFTDVVNIDAYQTYAPSKKFFHQNAYLSNNVTANNGVVSFNSFITYYGYGDNFPNTANTWTPYGMFPTAPKDGRYRVKARIAFTSKAAYQLSNNAPNGFQTRYELQVQKLDNGSYKHSTNFTLPDTSKWKIEKRKTVQRAPGTADQQLFIELDEIIDMKKGDMLRIGFYGNANAQMGNTSSVIGSKVIIDPTPANTYMEFGKFGSILNSTITNYATLLPRSMKQRDFILELARMFNLYFEADSLDNKTLIIEPRDAYYAQGVVRDYTKKIDYSKDLQIDILSHDFPKSTTFEYKADDKDYYCKLYEQVSGNLKQFGSYLFQSPNEYNVDESQLELKFAPSYIQKLDETNIKITKIIDPAKMEPDGASKTPAYKIQPRIMMYKPMPVSLPTYYFANIGVLGSSVAYTPFYISATNGFNTLGNYALTRYGYAGHLDDPNTPTFDLNWYTDFTYLPGTTPTTQNLINVFYKPQLIELSDASARKITCFVDLQPVDIHNLRFCDVYYFQKEYWRLLNISDYDTSSDVAQTTRCEFIKIVRANTNSLIDYTTFGYLGVNGGSAGGITGGIFGATDPETGQPLLMQLNGTSPVTEITQATYFDLMAQQNNLNLDVISGIGGLATLTELSPNTRFMDVAEQTALNANTLTNVISTSADRPTGDVFRITSAIIPTDETFIDYNYRTVLFDGVSDRRVFYNLFLPEAPNDGHTIKFDIANDGDFGIINFTNENIKGEEFYIVNYENKIEATYISDNDMWTIKRF